MPQSRLRNLIAITGGGQRNNCPPQRRRERAERQRLAFALDDMHGRRGEKEHDQEQHQNARQRSYFKHEHAAELGKAG